MASTGTKLDRRSAVEAQALATVRQLLTELGGSRGLEELYARGAAAHLERELGLASLERVELMLRLGDACGVRLPEQVMTEANSVEDLIEAILQEERSDPHLSGHARAAFASLSEEAGSATARAGLDLRVRAAESLTEILRLRGLGEPGRAHIHLYDGDRVRTITFGELYQRASSVAAELARRGLEPGQTVAIMLPTCAEFFPTFAGVLLAGGIPVPIYPPFRADRIAEYATRQSNILRNAGARFLITWRQAEGLGRLLRPNVPSLREVLNAQRLCAASAKADADEGSQGANKTWRPVENLTNHARGEDIAFLQYTSGSTGDPKGVILTHRNLLANIRSIVADVHIRSGDAAVSWLPLYHDMGLIGAWFVPLFAGIPMIVMSPVAFLTRPERWLWAIHRHKGTLSPAPNFAYELCVRRIADKDLEGLDLSCWRAALNGAEPVQPSTLERFVARFEQYGFRRGALLPVYGLAEASLGVSAPQVGSGYRIDRIERLAFQSSGRAVPAGRGDGAALEFVSAGKPLRDVECRIVGRGGEVTGERVEGRLLFRGPAATRGYYQNPAATRELLREGGWLDSGDLAYWADGELFITGRAKDVIIKGGRNLYPHEIEEIVGRIAGVRPGCVVAFGAPDERSGTEKFVVTAEIRQGAADRSQISAQISWALQDTLGLPPDVIELVPPQSIPKTSSGKLRRSETRRLYLEGRLGKKQQAPWMQMAKLAVGGAAPRGWAVVRGGARTVGELAYGVYALGACAVVVVPLWVLVLLTRDPNRAARMIRAAARMILRGALIPLRIEGQEFLESLEQTGPCIFTPNHSSYLDSLAIVALVPANVRFVAKGEAAKIPLFGAMMRRSGQYFFNRDDPRARVRQEQELEQALGRGESVVVYPEGTFTPITGIRPFQLGAFKAAVDARRPICPVAIRGARGILRDKTYLPKFGRLTVSFGPLIQPQPNASSEWQEIVRLRDETRETVARKSGEPLL
jgi:fatty-acyl-CoA synthase